MGKNKKIPKCKYCGKPCYETGPKTKQFTIPFTQTEILILFWGKMEYADICVECLNDVQNHDLDEMAEACFNDGYNRAYEEFNRF